MKKSEAVTNAAREVVDLTYDAVSTHEDTHGCDPDECVTASTLRDAWTEAESFLESLAEKRKGGSVVNYLESFRNGWRLTEETATASRKWMNAKSMAWAHFHGAMRATLRPVHVPATDPEKNYADLVAISHARMELDELETAEHAFAGEIGHPCDCPRCAAGRVGA